MKNTAFQRSYISVLSASAILACLAAAPSYGGTKEIKLATPEVAKASCTSHKIGEWVLAYFIGKDGIAQWGWGNTYNCQQKAVAPSTSGVGDAIDASGTLHHLATPEDAMKFCKSHQMGEWDLAYINGKGGLVQWGWGAKYDCKQAPVAGSVSGIGNAIVNE